MKKKFIFLDFDGVMLPFQNFEYINNDKFDNKCVKSLNNIIEKFNNVKIIITSDWQSYYNLDQIKKVFSNSGIIVQPYDVTGKNVKTKVQNIALERAQNILNYCNYNGIEDKDFYSNSVIIDDLHLNRIFTNAIQTDPYIGLPDIENEVINFLSSATFV